MKKIVQSVLGHLGYRIVRATGHTGKFPPDLTAEDISIINLVRPFTMTSEARIVTLIHAVKYLEAARIPGAYVECGVWRGGSMMCVAHALKMLGVSDRELFLYDTFEGMTEPGRLDMRFDDFPASNIFRRFQIKGGKMAYAALDEVRRNMATTGYPDGQLHFVQGRVEDTIPGQSTPETIAMLRLDTDWYDSTKHELVQLFPRLAVGGVLIIDDYGYFKGCKQATDEYFIERGLTPFLQRIDAEARLVIKTA